MTRIAADSDAVFAEAVGRGAPSDDPGDSNFAGHCMYMFRDAKDAARFKHRGTRASVRVGLAAGNGLSAGKGLAPGNGAAPGNRAAARQRPVEDKAGQP